MYILLYLLLSIFHSHYLTLSMPLYCHPFLPLLTFILFASYVLFFSSTLLFHCILLILSMKGVAEQGRHDRRTGPLESLWIPHVESGEGRSNTRGDDWPSPFPFSFLPSPPPSMSSTITFPSANYSTSQLYFINSLYSYLNCLSLIHISRTARGFFLLIPCICHVYLSGLSCVSWEFLGSSSAPRG